MKHNKTSLMRIQFVLQVQWNLKVEFLRGINPLIKEKTLFREFIGLTMETVTF